MASILNIIKKSTESGSQKSKLLLFGADGMLGSDLFELLSSDFDLTGRTERDSDVTLYTDISRAVSAARPDIIVNATGYTKVDDAEIEREKAEKVNGEALKHLSKICRERDALLVHFSTDYVFDGEHKKPYREDDETSPINHYGLTKLMGEKEILSSGCQYIIIRTQWLYGPHGKNFVFSIIDKLKKEGRAMVVDDQVGCPTYSADLAEAVCCLLEENKRGIFNFSSSGEASWFEFASKIAELSLPDPVDIVPVKSSAFETRAKRPFYSVLSKEKYAKETGNRPRDWDKMLPDFLKRVFEGGVAW